MGHQLDFEDVWMASRGKYCSLILFSLYRFYLHHLGGWRGLGSGVDENGVGMSQCQVRAKTVIPGPYMDASFESFVQASSR